MEQKYVIFLLALFVGVPLGIIMVLLWRRFHDFVFAAMVLGTAQPYEIFGFNVDINLISREWYRGTTRGIEISYLDMLCLILIVSTLLIRHREGRGFFWPPGLGFLLVYFAWCLINVGIFSHPKIFGVFELVQILRGILIFLATTAYVRSPREFQIFLWTFVVGIVHQAGVCVAQRYIEGIHRVEGTLIHPNMLSSYSLLYVPISISICFSTDLPQKLSKAGMLGYACAAVCVILSISRMGFAALILISLFTVALSTGFRFNVRNIGIGALGGIVLTAMVLYSWETIMSRMTHTDIATEWTEAGDRGSYFFLGAPAIWEKPVLGLGLNNWSYWISNRYAEIVGFPSSPYDSLDRPPSQLGQHPPAHNLYLLTLVELGWPGLLLFLALLCRWLWVSGSAFLNQRKTQFTEFRFASCISLLGLMIQNWTEWSFRLTPIFLLIHIIMGVDAVLYYYQHRAGSDNRLGKAQSTGSVGAG